MKHLPLTAVALAALVAGCSAVADATSTKLEQAYDACMEQDGKKSGDSYFDEPTDYASKLNLADEGHTLIIETAGEDDTDGFLAYLCITTELDTPERVTSSIETTTSMMGRQSSKDEGLTYEYTYHPDYGLHVLITDQG